MPLADTPPVAPPTSKRCGIAKLDLDDQDAATLDEWLGKWPDAWIADRLAEETGKHVTYQIVQRHRHQRCSCYRDNSR